MSEVSGIVTMYSKQKGSIQVNDKEWYSPDISVKDAIIARTSNGELHKGDYVTCTLNDAGFMTGFKITGVSKPVSERGKEKEAFLSESISEDNLKDFESKADTVLKLVDKVVKFFRDNYGDGYEEVISSVVKYLLWGK